MIRVVVFEDNVSLRASLCQLINDSAGFVCVGGYADCNDVVRRIEEDIPDVVVMDIQMPGMDGIDAVEIIHQQFPKIKIMMQTIFEDEDKIFRSICAGASGYILKNTSPARFIELVKETYEGGAPLSPPIANKVLRMVARKDTLKTNGFDLSEREKDILRCLVEGMSYKMIADACFISIDTVRTHIRNLYEKLHVHSKSEAVAKAIKANIV